MAVYFADTSALAKRYFAETGSQWIRAELHPSAGNVIVVVNLVAIELASAVARRQRGGSISAQQATFARADIQHDLAFEYFAVDVDQVLIAAAVQFAELYGLRAYDAVQLAAARRVDTERRAQGLESITLLCSDVELSAAARSEGIALEDPNDHP